MEKNSKSRRDLDLDQKMIRQCQTRPSYFYILPYVKGTHKGECFIVAVEPHYNNNILEEFVRCLPGKLTYRA